MQKAKAGVAATIRDMTRADLDRVGEILFEAFNTGAAAHGYAPRLRDRQEGTAWAWALLRHAPGAVLIADVERRAVGICCLNPRGVHGGIGPVAVDPSYHGHGVGRQLMDAVLERAAELQSVRLFQETFNAAAFKLYTSCGFQPVAELLDLTRSPDGPRTVEPSAEVIEAGAEELDAISEYDAARSRLDRRSDLAYFQKWGKLFVLRDGAQVRGFLAGLPAAPSVQLGPLVAEGVPEAARLFRHAVAAFGERRCQTRVMAKDVSLITTLEAMGFELYCKNNLMVRGAWRPGAAIEAFGRFPEGA